MKVEDVARTVLVVDDNAENRALAKATLEDEGVRVVLANSGQAAIAAFEREQADCILLDIRMPGLDGVATCERIRALPGGPEVAIVFVTAQRDVETFDRALAAGGDDFITKPYRPGELVVRVQTALRLRKIAVERSELFAQLKRQRDDLQRLELHRDQLSSFLVHDLKNPVHAIELQAQRVLRGANADGRAHDAASRIIDETRALMRMITNLLDIGRADEGRLLPVSRELDAKALLDPVFDELRIRASSAQVALVAAIEAPAVRADPDLMHRVLANLIDNALRFAPEGSEVRVRVTGDEISVSDSGPGIPPELRESMFDRFVSGDRTGRSNRGLGLAFCKLAVEAHGGKISIDDAHPGAVFRIHLPRAPAS